MSVLNLRHPTDVKGVNASTHKKKYFFLSPSLTLTLSPCFSTADGRGADVRRGLHGRRGVPAGHSDDCQLPAVSPTQALALRTTLHEPLQRGSDGRRLKLPVTLPV